MSNISKENITRLVEIVEKYGYRLLVNEESKKLVTTKVVRGRTEYLYINFIVHEGIYYAYNLNTNFLPSDLYSDSTSEKAGSYNKRQDSIIKNITTILSGGLKVKNLVTPLLRRHRYTMMLDIDGEKSEITTTIKPDLLWDKSEDKTDL